MDVHVNHRDDDVVAIAAVVINHGRHAGTQEVRGNHRAVRQPLERSRNRVDTVVADDHVGIIRRRHEPAERQRVQRHVAADCHGAVHRDLIMIGSGIAGRRAADLDFKRTAVGKREIPVHVENSGRLTRRDGAIQRQHIAAGERDVRSRVIVDLAAHKRHGIRERGRLNVDDA